MNRLTGSMGLKTPSSVRLGRRMAIIMLTLLGTSTPIWTEASAENYPARPVRIIVPYAPGGGNDIFARLIGGKLSENWGSQVLVENRSGAGGNIGAELAARAPSDGYTLLMANNAFTINPFIYSKLSFDVTKDFVPVSLVVTSPMLVVVNKDAPVNNMADLIDYARQRPGVLNYGTPGAGTPQHLATELFKTMTQTDLVHVPYQGTGPSVTGLLRNDVNIMFATPASVEQHVRTGALRAVGVTSASRARAFPDVPTLAESGVPNYDIDIWWGLVAPAGVPEGILKQLNAAIAKAVQSEDVRIKIHAQGAEPRVSSQEQFATLIRDDLSRWKEIVSKAGIVGQ